MRLQSLSIPERRAYIEKEIGFKLNHTSQVSYSIEVVEGHNCENVIGVTQVPLGIAGPILVKNNKKSKNYFLPLATTEGALVASVSRGCKVVTQTGGARVMVEKVGATRGPYLRVKNLQQAREIIDWIKNHWPELKTLTAQDAYISLNTWQWQLVGRTLYIRFSFNTHEAMGMNMATIASERILQKIRNKFKVRSCTTGNFCIDKKPAYINQLLGRGKKVWAEAVIKKELVKKILKTSPEEIIEVVHLKQHLGSIMAGSLGFNAHFANIIAAIYLATGQDPAHVVEGSLGVTTAELQDKDLYFSVYLPALMVGTVGGGTGLPTQKEALEILGFNQPKPGNAIELSGIIGAAVLAGELSLTAAVASGDLGKAHDRLGRSNYDLK